ncbi:MAG: glycosyltransferase family 1 protein, partial [Micavibrio aeruginosavorus]
MKVLIVTDAWHPQINGVVRTYEYLRTELEEMGHVVKIIGPSDFPLSFP